MEYNEILLGDINYFFFFSLCILQASYTCQFPYAKNKQCYKYIGICGTPERAKLFVCLKR